MYGFLVFTDNNGATDMLCHPDLTGVYKVRSLPSLKRKRYRSASDLLSNSIHNN